MLLAKYGDLTLGRQPRPSQLDALVALLGERQDVLCVAATGSGKSLIVQVAAAAHFREASPNDGEALPPVALVVVPFKGLAEHQYASMCAYMRGVFKAGLLPREARVLYVDRSAPGDALEPDAGDVATAPSASVADVGDVAEPAPRALRVPGQLPCEFCVGCTRQLPPNLLANLPEVAGTRCCWSCRVSAPYDRDRWCKWCRTRGKGNGCNGCEERKRSLESLGGVRATTPPTAWAPDSIESTPGNRTCGRGLSIVTAGLSSRTPSRTKNW